MLQRSSAGKRKRTGDLDVEIKCYMTLQPSEKDEFVQSIKQLYQSESLCDITFKVGGQLFPAHKIILAAANRLHNVSESYLSSIPNSRSLISSWQHDYLLADSAQSLSYFL